MGVFLIALTSGRQLRSRPLGGWIWSIVHWDDYYEVTESAFTSLRYNSAECKCCECEWFDWKEMTCPPANFLNPQSTFPITPTTLISSERNPFPAIYLFPSWFLQLHQVHLQWYQQHLWYKASIIPNPLRSLLSSSTKPRLSISFTSSWLWRSRESRKR